MTMEDPLDDPRPIIHRVERALENIRACLEVAQKKPSLKRKSTRYERRQLHVDFQFFRAGTSNLLPQLHRYPVVDVSAGGMRIDVDASLEVAKGQRLKFCIVKPTREAILSGAGQVVRLAEAEDGRRTLGVQFQVLTS